MNYYNEFDPYAAEWLENLIAFGCIAPGDVDRRSIVDVRPNDLKGYTQCHFFAGIGGWSQALKLVGWPDERPVWTGSCPCQPFSAAGQRKGTADERHLWPEFARLIAECGPPVVFGEQVASKAGREWLAGVRADLEALGYAVGAADLCAAGAGAPHIRQRLYWLADARRPGVQCGRGPGEAHGAAGPLEGDARQRQRVGSDAGGSGELGRMADADGGLAGNGELQSRGQHGQQPQDGRAGGVADTQRDGGRADEPQRRPQERAADGWSGRSDIAGADRLGNTGNEGPQGRRVSGHRADQRPAGETGLDGGLEHATSDGWIERRTQPGERGVVGGCGQDFWSTYNIVQCTDGKARRFEPGAFPLAHGVSNRVGRLRGYGNAIVPQVAAGFISAYLDIA